MAEDELNAVMQDLQLQLRTAKVDVNNLSTIAQKGDEKVSKTSASFRKTPLIIW